MNFIHFECYLKAWFALSMLVFKLYLETIEFTNSDLEFFSFSWILDLGFLERLNLKSACRLLIFCVLSKKKRVLDWL